MSIQQGDPIPNVKVFELDDQGAPRSMSAAERFAGKRIVLFALQLHLDDCQVVDEPCQSRVHL